VFYTDFSNVLIITNVTKLKPNCGAVSDSVYANRIFIYKGALWEEIVHHSA
jgi:hypothetical protein